MTVRSAAQVLRLRADQRRCRFRTSARNRPDSETPRTLPGLCPPSGKNGDSISRHNSSFAGSSLRVCLPRSPEDAAHFLAPEWSGFFRKSPPFSRPSRRDGDRSAGHSVSEARRSAPFRMLFRHFRNVCRFIPGQLHRAGRLQGRMRCPIPEGIHSFPVSEEVQRDVCLFRNRQKLCICL